MGAGATVCTVNLTSTGMGLNHTHTNMHTQHINLNVSDLVIICYFTICWLRILCSRTICGNSSYLVHTEVPFSLETGTSRLVHVLFDVFVSTKEVI